MSIVEKAQELFFKMIDDFGKDPYTLRGHLPEVEKWAKICMKEITADEEVVLLGVWLHDIGHYPITDLDHAVGGEERTMKFLVEQGYNPEKIKQVVHCVRAHRCKDVMPETIEAKIVAFSDSASHMTQDMYLGMAKKFSQEETLAKIERDYRDLGIFPNLKEKLTPLYLAWKQLVETYREVMNDIQS